MGSRAQYRCDTSYMDERDDMPQRATRDGPPEPTERELQLLAVLLSAASEYAHYADVLSAHRQSERLPWRRRL